MRDDGGGVDGGGNQPKPYAVKFVTQPNNSVVDVPISGTAYVSTAPFVTVEIVDCHGNVVNTSAPVTITLGANPTNVGNYAPLVTKIPTPRKGCK